MLSFAERLKGVDGGAAERTGARVHGGMPAAVVAGVMSGPKIQWTGGGWRIGASAAMLLLNEPFPRSGHGPHSTVKIDTTPPPPCLRAPPPRTHPRTPAELISPASPSLSASIASLDSLWSLQRHPRHNGRGLLPVRPPSCLCQTVSAHLQQPAPSAYCSCLKQASSVPSSPQSPTQSRNPPNSSCRIGASRWFFLFTRKSRGDLARN